MKRPRRRRRGGLFRPPRRGRRLLRRVALVWVLLLTVSWFVRLTTPSPYTAPPELDGGVRRFVLTPQFDAQGREIEGSTMRLAFYRWAADEDDRLDGRPPVLLLHGSPGEAAGMTALAAILADEGYVVYAFDLPGMGMSEGWVDDFGARSCASSILAAMHNLSIDRAHVVGWSWSGTVVTLMADRAPDRIASMTLLAASVSMEAEGTGDWRFERAKYAIGYAAIVVAPELIPHFGFLGTLSSRHAFIRNFWDTDLRPMRDILARVETPTLILHGRRDILVPAWGAEYHHTLAPNSRLVMLDAGHFLPMGEPFGQATETAAHLLPFLERHDLPGVTPFTGVADFAPVKLSKVTDFGMVEVSRSMHWAVIILLIILATFISEDATVIAVGLAIAHGQIDPFVGLIGCFTGILLGDGGLWAMGRFVGRRALRWPLVRAWVPEASLDRWGRWFDRHSIAAVFVARAFPGTRVPTYFAAGLLSKRTHGFLIWATLAVLIWTPLLLTMVILVGPRLVDAVERVLGGPVAIVAVIVFLLIVYRVLTYAFTWTGRRRLLADALRVGRPEFWPSFVFYFPLIPWVAYLALRRGGPMTFTCVNPGIAHGGGVVGESKIEIFRALASAGDRLVATAFIDIGMTPVERANLVARLVREDETFAGYPVILKPNEAQRGHGFKVIRNREDAVRYFTTMTRAALLQAFHPGPFEAGVLWKREPGEQRGRVFSVTKKVFPIIEGDGESTLERLIWKHPRFMMQADLFLKRYDAERDRVLGKGEKMRIAVAGNHCQGTMFVDGADLITPEFERAIDEVAMAFEGEGLDFGRFDIRYASEDDLRAGKGFKIIELNGTMSESTNIYDPNKPIWWAYGILLRQWDALYRIGVSRRRAGVRPMTLRELIRTAAEHYRGRPGSSVAD